MSKQPPSSLSRAPLQSPAAGAEPGTALLVHVSDLHVGASSAHDFAAAALVAALVEDKTDIICLTGDVTDSGSRKELALFWRLFEPLRDKLVIVPGNHDRGSDNAGNTFVPGGAAAWVRDFPQHRVRCICLDSTQPGNEVAMFAWGGVTPEQIEYAAQAADIANAGGFFPVVLMHHHVLPRQGAEDVVTAVSDALKLPFMRHADNGMRLLARLPGHCLVLHGHKHASTAAPPVYNAGSTTESTTYRQFWLVDGTVMRQTQGHFRSQWTPEAEDAIRASRQ